MEYPNLPADHSVQQARLHTRMILNQAAFIYNVKSIFVISGKNDKMSLQFHI